MARSYLPTLTTPDVLAAQQEAYGRAQAIPAPEPSARDPLGPEEAAFIAARDSLYLATVTADGWPYLQHRGGSPGFVRLLDPHTLGFADLKGNRQLLTTGNLRGSDRVAVFWMDYPNRERLKVLGHARTLPAAEHPELRDRLLPDAALAGRVERLFVIDVVSFDWNCPQYITPRWTRPEIESALVAPLQRRIAELEAELASRARNADPPSTEH